MAQKLRIEESGDLSRLLRLNAKSRQRSMKIRHPSYISLHFSNYGCFNGGKRILELEKSLKSVNENIRILSITDPLTGAYNCGYLTEHLPQEIRRARRYAHALSVVLCDIDYFKKVNERAPSRR